MTVFTGDEVLLLRHAADGGGVVDLQGLRLRLCPTDPPSLEPAMGALVAAGLFVFRERPQLHYRLTAAGWAACGVAS